MSTTKPPAFQFYAADFLVGTADMSCEEVGAYIRLLCYQWTKGGIPSDISKASQMAGCTNGTSIAQALLKHKFSIGLDGMYRNNRLEEVRAEQQAFRERQSNRGKTGAKARWENASANAQAMPKQCPDDGSSSSSSSSIDRWIPPALEEVKLLAAKIGLPEVEAVKFWNYYNDQDWKRGKNRLKRIGGALANWKLRCSEYNGTPKSSSQNGAMDDLSNGGRPPWAC